MNRINSKLGPVSRGLACLVALAGLWACSLTPPKATGLSRCIWVSRWSWKTAADLERIMRECSAAGFTAVMLQVRGNGTALFPSKHEVFSDAFGYRDPGFDPLEVAIRAAHSHRLELHAWINVMPGWSGDRPPADGRQLWNRQPGWFLQDQQGARQPLAKGGYLCLNPCLPEVRDYLATLCGEVAQRYAVDGIHLDYIRFVDRDSGDATYPLDKRSLALFRAESTGRDKAAFEAWKTDCVTQLLRAIKRQVAASPRSPVLTAAVIADQERALTQHNQDWPAWARERLVAALLPMNYSRDDQRMAALSRQCVQAAAGVPVIMGVGAYQHQDPAQTVRQMETALRLGAQGIAVFSYEQLASTTEANARPADWRRAFATWRRGS